MLSKSIGGFVIRETVGGPDVHPQQITNRVVIFGAVQPACGHAPRVGPRGSILPGELRAEIGGHRLHFRGGRLWNRRRRHLARLEFRNDLFPDLTVLVKGSGILKARKIDIARSFRRIVTAGTILPHKAEHRLRVGCGEGCRQ
jgi:hypothetical protein